MKIITIVILSLVFVLNLRSQSLPKYPVFDSSQWDNCCGFGPGHFCAFRYDALKNECTGGSKLHNGIDFVEQSDKQIKPINCGRVIYSNQVDGDGLGPTIVIEHLLENGEQIFSQYSHLSTIYIKKGDIVTKETTIGLEGDAGDYVGAYPPHLHLETKKAFDHTEDGSWGGTLADPSNPSKKGDYRRCIANPYGNCYGTFATCPGYTPLNENVNLETDLGFINPYSVIGNPNFRAIDPLQFFKIKSTNSNFELTIKTNFTGNFSNNGEWEGIIYIEGMHTNGTWETVALRDDVALIENTLYRDVPFTKILNGNFSNYRVSISNKEEPVNLENRIVIKHNDISYDEYLNCYDGTIEPNGGFALAKDIPYEFSNQNVSGYVHESISTYNDQDYFKINISMKGYLFVSLSDIENQYELEFYDSSKIPLFPNSSNSSTSFFNYSIVNAGSFYIKVHNSINEIQCNPYKLNFQWTPDAVICNDIETSLSQNSSSRNNSSCHCFDSIQNGDETGVDCGGSTCPSCACNVSLTTPDFEPIFDGSTYTLQSHLIDSDLSKKYNVYAVDENGLVGTTSANVSPKSSSSGEYNIILNDFGCGKTIVLRAEQVDDPYNCYYEIPITTPVCEPENKSITVSWPGLQGQCFTFDDNNTINWSSTSNISNVDIYVCQSGGQCIPIVLDLPNTGSYQWIIPPYVGDFQIKINESANSLISDSGSYFEIDDDCIDNECDPTTVLLLQPSNGSTFLLEQDIYFDFISNFSQSCQLEEYEFWVSGSSDFPENNTNKITLQTSSFGPLNTSNAITFYWKVRAKNIYGQVGPWSSTFTFTVSNSIPDYVFNDNYICSSLVNSDECGTEASYFDFGESVYASCHVSDLRKSMRVKFVWKNSQGNELYTDYSSSHIGNGSGDYYFSSSYLPAITGDFSVDFYSRIDGSEVYLGNEIFTVNDVPTSNAIGNLEMINVESSDAAEDGIVYVNQGGTFRLRSNTEFDGDLSIFPNKTFEPRIGYFLKRLRSSNVTSSWNIFLGEDNLRFQCSQSSSICDRVWEDSESEVLRIGYDVPPRTYFVLSYIDWLNEWEETNENVSDQRDYQEIVVLPYCNRIWPIYDENETTTSVDLSWEENANVESTDIRFRISGDLVWIEQDEFLNGATLHNLQPCTQYEFQVQGNCIGDTSVWSPSRYFSLQCEFPCVPPSGRYEQVNESRALVYWDEIEPVYLYEVRWRQLNSLNWNIEDLESSTWDKIKNLEIETTYEWQVRSRCPANVYSEWSVSRIFTTNSNCIDGIQNGQETGVDCGGSCIPCHCQEQYYQLNYPIDKDLSIHVQSQIRAEDLINEQSNTILKAGESMLFKPGFHATPGSVVQAQIEGCNE